MSDGVPRRSFRKSLQMQFERDLVYPGEVRSYGGCSQYNIGKTKRMRSMKFQALGLLKS